VQSITAADRGVLNPHPYQLDTQYSAIGATVRNLDTQKKPAGLLALSEDLPRDERAAGCVAAFGGSWQPKQAGEESSLGRGGACGAVAKQKDLSFPFTVGFGAKATIEATRLK